MMKNKEKKKKTETKQNLPKILSKFIISYSGSSRDQRTNSWDITCNCGKYFSPLTTMLALQEVECPKCGYTEIINYNKIQQQ
jgi:hypothetical protein